MSQPKNYLLSLIIPAFNEEKKIEKDIEAAFVFFEKNKIHAEVIVSTDGVTDKTNEKVRRLQSRYKDLKLMRRKERAGKGFAIKNGVREARGKYIMFADAGLCVSYDKVLEGLKKLEEGYDFVLASRADKRSVVVKFQPFYRQIGARIFGYIVKYMLGIPKNIPDTQCGFKFFKNHIAKKLFHDLRTRGLMFDIEIILLAKKYGLKITDFPVSWTVDWDSKLKPLSDSIGIIKDLLVIKLIYKL